MKSRGSCTAHHWRRFAAAWLLALGALALVDCDRVMPRHSWSRQWGPMVPHTSFPGDCVTCHYPEQWDILREEFDFDHGAVTGHPLRGAHVEAACLRCHNDRGPVTVYAERGCGGCHVDPHQGSLGSDCGECHSEDLWQPHGLIAEHARTRFPLLAAHAVTACDSCHPAATAGRFRDAPVECHLCHQREAQRAFPNHVLNGWTRNCGQCHTPLDWTTPDIRHDFFPLAGGHAGLDCSQCHVGGQFTPIPPDCIACHQNDYLEAPNHVAEARSTDCTECHNTTAWE